ncbi:MAG: hypothetical protein AMXMBFR13_37690 [Phycisphaerae bacterium]
MHCSHVKRVIEDYWDRALPAEASHRVELHLAGCPACRSEFGGVDDLLRRPSLVDVPAGLSARIAAAIEANTPDGRRAATSRRDSSAGSRLLSNPASGAVAACLTFLLLGWLSSMLPVEQQSGPVPTPGTPPLSPALLASVGQSMTLPVPVSPLAAVAQAAALEQFMQSVAEPAPVSVRNLSFIEEAPVTDPPSAVQRIPIIISRLSALGA